MLHISLWENDPSSHLIYYLSDQIPGKFNFLITNFKYSFFFLNFGPISSKIGDKAGCALGCGYHSVSSGSQADPIKISSPALRSRPIIITSGSKKS